MPFRSQIATRLRGLAQLIDGREIIDAKWHKASVTQMNAYIERTEDELHRLRGRDENGELFLKINYISRGLLQGALDVVEDLQTDLDSTAAQLGLRLIHKRLRIVLTGKE